MMQRLLMPLFARLQASAKDLRRAVELSVFAVAALVVPVQTTVWALQEPVVRIVFGSQWLDSLPVYRWLWFAATLEPELVVAIALLNALGHADRTLRFVATTTAFLWLAGVPLLLLVGPTGYGIAATLMLAIKWRLVAEADATTDTRSLAIVVPVWISGLASAFVTALVARAWPPSSPLSLAVLLAACLATYSVFLYLAARDRTTTALRWLRAQLVLAMAGGAAPGAARSAAGSLD
jgi:PST family polysaccharide transporter